MTPAFWIALAAWQTKAWAGFVSQATEKWK
ncbi:hypothetical protein MAL1_00160 [Bacteriophage DSS3_MAL1]|nr:hypothetical protein MAL1_00160 [Bacteriophage DSS3_MAL1]